MIVDNGPDPRTLPPAAARERRQGNILLVFPPAPRMTQWAPELALGYLAAALQRAEQMDCGVEVLDCVNEGLSVEGFKRRIAELPPFDVIGFKVFSPYLNESAACVRAVKEVSPRTVTVAGGPHVSVSEPETLFGQMPALDYAIAGEGIRSLPLLVKHLAGEGPEKTAIPGLRWRENGATFSNGQDFGVDIDLYGPPDWSKIDPRRYGSREPFSYYTWRTPVAQIITSRGCPFQCTFCSTFKVVGRKVRLRPVENIIAEVRMLARGFGVKSVEFVDDNFLINKKVTAALCRRLIEEDLGITWSCPQGLHLASVDEEILQLMEKSGCTYLAAGIESGSDRILKEMRKGLDKKVIAEKLSLIRDKSKIKTMGFFILGFPGETEEEMLQTIEFAASLPLDLATFSVYIFYPGTPDSERLVAAHPALKGHIASFAQEHDLIVRRGLSASAACRTVPVERLNQLARAGHLKFFMNPRRVLDLLLSVRSIMQVRILLRWMKTHLS